MIAGIKGWQSYILALNEAGVNEKVGFPWESKGTWDYYIGITSVLIHSHHDRKTLEFEADPASNNVASNSRGHFVMKNPISGVPGYN